MKKRHLLVSALSLTSLLSLTLSIPSVWFISQLGDPRGFILIEGAKMQSSYNLLTADSLCTCRRQCITLPRCVAASFVAWQHSNECQLSTADINSTHFTLQEDSWLMMWRTMKGIRFWIANDGRLYLWLQQLVPVSEAQAACQRIPGFHLGVYSTRRSFYVIKNFYEKDGTDVAVNLNLVDGQPTWADGTSHYDTHIFSIYGIMLGKDSYFKLSAGVIRNTAGSELARVLCQADPMTGRIW
ncbi:uncharacterized protein LOC119573274 isoform X2 [Penaeus monodon]|nr:uncharacterized protein LOC119573274 isoform X2 [Penaeus monodon]